MERKRCHDRQAWDLQSGRQEVLGQQAMWGCRVFSVSPGRLPYSVSGWLAERRAGQSEQEEVAPPADMDGCGETFHRRISFASDAGS